MRLFNESIIVSFKCGKQIFSGIPGNPALSRYRPVFRSPHVHIKRQGDGIIEMLGIHLLPLGNPGKIHFLIPFDQFLEINFKLFQLGWFERNAMFFKRCTNCSCIESIR